VCRPAAVVFSAVMVYKFYSQQGFNILIGVIGYPMKKQAFLMRRCAGYCDFQVPD
jgi:hypothetical protein